MPTSRLRIDTSIAGYAGPSSETGSSRSGVTPGSFPLRSSKSTGRLRSGSSASVSSSTSAASRAVSKASSSVLSPEWNSSSSSRTSRVDQASFSPTDSTEGVGRNVCSEYVLAMHDFAPQHQNDTCLAFRAGQVIHVLNRDSSGWWDGELDGRRGWFPSNYVTSDVGLLTEEELPKITRARNGAGHAYTTSTVSTTSWTSTTSHPISSSYIRTDHRPMAADNPSLDTYCPPLMVPLLQGISLLQNAVKANRVAHYQPSTACVLSCVRTLLSEVGCLARDAPMLKQYPVLARERKQILSGLASLVSQAKKASAEGLHDQQRELEVESMVRLAGQLFAHVRGFLVSAVQCGVSVQPTSHALSSQFSSSDGRWDSQEGTLVRSDNSANPFLGDYGTSWDSKGTTNGIAERRRQRESTATPSLRAKSMSDLRTKVKEHASIIPALPKTNMQKQPWSVVTPVRRFASGGTVGHKVTQPSVSSVSSSSSFSSNESIGTPPTPMFPTGPSSTAEVMDALRHTHDNYLSTIAAFIGHAHSHSRTSHASSTGHMYDLVREVVEMVCKLLTIVEAVLRHPGIPLHKAQDLRAAKEGVYNVTSTLADSVRMLTTEPSPDISEEEEKTTLLRSATNALKAGSDCVNAVKKCLQRPTGERPFVIDLPDVGDVGLSVYTPSKFSHRAPIRGGRLRDASSMNALRELYRVNGVSGDEEDLTIQAQTDSFADTTVRLNGEANESHEKPTIVIPETDGSLSASPSPSPVPASAVDDKPLPPVRPSLDSVSLRPSSPVSFAPTEDDRTTWEGSHQRHHQATQSLEEKLIHGDLPAVPENVITDLPRPDPMSWILSHDHDPEDVAYNSEGQLVGATLPALVERMTPHDSLVEPPFAAVFFLTFRQFTSPPELLDALIARYNIMPPQGIHEQDLFLWQQRKGLPVRLRVSNFVKSWLESYWRPEVDNVVLTPLFNFTRDALALMFPVPSQRILELLAQWQAAGDSGVAMKVDRVRDAGFNLNPPLLSPSDIPRPVINKTLFSALKIRNYNSVSLTDFDPAELGRQLTTMECQLYCAIQPEEILETGQDGGIYARNVKAVTSLSTVITGWVAESILDEPDTKKRTALVKFFIKVADRCTSVQNFSTPRSILAALDSSTISRLHQTWSGLPQKNRLQLEAIRKLADHARNYHEYRTRLRNTAPPAVPFLGLYLTDITFCREGNPSHRASPKNPEKKLLNFNKYHKLARIVQDMQRFQYPYNFKEIPEIQEYLRDAFEKAKHRGDLQDLYRRSLLVEPRRPADNPPTSDVRQLFGWASRSSQPTPVSAL
ncbi:unnamed protein product [Somion occarium]|uniref:Ras GEF n=1 Tax=Somion occarium TaxID=3059160 RepID=A0ABP1DYM7_9APHY